MALNSSANIQSKIDVTVTDSTSTKRTYVKNFNNGYLYSYTQGIESGNMNAGVFISGSIPSGESINFDMRALVEESFGTSSTYQFASLGALNLYNMSHVSGANLKLRATGVGATASNPGGGSNAFTNLFGPHATSSGDINITPYGTFQVNDPDNDIKVTNTNRYLGLFADGSSADYLGGCSGAIPGGPGAAGCWEYVITIAGITGA